MEREVAPPRSDFFFLLAVRLEYMLRCKRYGNDLQLVFSVIT